MRITQNKLINGLLVLLCILSAQMFAPLTSVAGYNMTLTAKPTSVPADGSTPSVITAIVDQDGSTVGSGVALKFTLLSGPGQLQSGTSTITTYTDSTGTSTVRIYSSQAGNSTVNCTAETLGNLSGNVYVGFTALPVDPVIPPEPYPASFVLSVDPPAVPADNLTFSAVTAQLYDQYGKSLWFAGVSVSFTTSPEGLAHFSNNLTAIKVSTDGFGQATALLYSPVVGTAAVNATCLSFTTNPVYVNFTGSGPTADILLTADLASNPADNLSASKITATLLDSFGKTVPSGIKVTFRTTLGTFSNNDILIDAYTDSKGVAVAYISSGSIGTAQISASSNGITRHVNISFTGSGPTADILLTADPASNPADNLSASKITATLLDSFGKTVPSGTKVTFRTTLGKFSNNDILIDAYTDTMGVATAFVSSGSVGSAQISASSNGVTRYINISFTGVGPPAFISLNATPNWIPADGYSYTAITAVILDSTAQPVAAGTTVSFSTTLGVFKNGKTTYQTVTSDDQGTVTAYLRSSNTIFTGNAVINCTAGTVTQSLTVGIVRLEYETEPNNDMAHADALCFNNVFLSQLSSPYEEDWYTFTITQPSRIGINFITTAIPKIAGDCKDSTTVGTYRVDIRDKDNNVLMSYQNIDCIYDNGIWETGVVPVGTYYVVVFCPRLPDNSHYLSTPYYLAVFDSFYLPCGESDVFVNAASLYQTTSVYHLHVPIIDTIPYLWGDFQYDPNPSENIMFRLTNYGVIANLSDYRSCNLSNLSLIDSNLVLHIPILLFNGISYRADLTHVPTSDGIIWFVVSGVWLN